MESKFKLKVLPFLCGVAASITFLIGVIFATACLVAFSKPFYDAANTKYQLLDEVGFEQTDFDTVVRALIDYMSGKTDELSAPATVDGVFYNNFYEGRSAAHMADVKTIFTFVKITAMVFLPLSALLTVCALILTKRRPKKSFCHGTFIGLALLFVLLAGLGTWIAIDFNGAFIAFHHLVFTNDLWLLDPAVDFMIRMLPGGVFLDASVIIVSAGVVALILLLVLVVILRRRDKILSQKPPSYLSEI